MKNKLLTVKQKQKYLHDLYQWLCEKKILSNVSIDGDGLALFGDISNCFDVEIYLTYVQHACKVHTLSDCLFIVCFWSKSEACSYRLHKKVVYVIADDLQKEIQLFLHEMDSCEISIEHGSPETIYRQEHVALI